MANKRGMLYICESSSAQQKVPTYNLLLANVHKIIG